MGTWPREAARPRVPSSWTVPVSETLVSVRAGRAWMRRCHCWGSGSQRAKSASVREKGDLFVVELEVEAGAGGFDVGEAGGGAGSFLGGGGGVDVGGVEEDALEVPLAVGEVDEVDAGVGEADGGELDAAAPEGADAEGGADGVGADDGLGAEGGVFVDDEVFESEAGEREEVQADPVEMDGAAEAVADAVGDALLIAIDADERREQDEEKDRQGCEGEVEKAAQGMGAERRAGVCVRRLRHTRRLDPFPA